MRPTGLEVDCAAQAGAIKPIPRVTIVMCTYQGERFLNQQLASLAAQTHRNWQLYVSDDGSKDATCDIIREFAAGPQNNRVVLVTGRRQGFAKNFLSALCAAPAADYYAFSDQDDVWHEDKLSRAITTLQNESRAALYCGRTRLVDDSGRPIGFSPAFRRVPLFANALVQSIAGGNTMVMNDAMRDLARSAGADLDIVSHDWWLYQLVTGAGGRLHYDLVPAIDYRQHDGNLVGRNNAVIDRIRRLGFMLTGGFREWTDRNIAALRAAEHLLSPDSRRVLNDFQKIRSSSFLQRYRSLSTAGVYRQTWLGTIGLLAAVILNRI